MNKMGTAKVIFTSTERGRKGGRSKNRKVQQPEARRADTAYSVADSGLPEFSQHSVNLVECGVDILSDLGTSQNDLARDEDE